MGLTRQYLRYVPSGILNFLASQRCNICTVHGAIEEKGRQKSRSVWICFACSDVVYVWDIRMNQKVAEFRSVAHDVTCLTFFGDEKLFAAGYSDGSVAAYNLLTEQLVFSQKGHRSSVTCLAFNSDGSFMASGSNDTEVILWDIVAQTVICRLKGHKGPVTDCHFMKNHPYLVTSSKDSFVKIWDLQAYRCCSTLVGHKSEVSCFLLFTGDNRIVTASNDMEMRMFDVNFEDTQYYENFENAETDVAEDGLPDKNSPVKWRFLGSIIRQGKGGILSMILDKSETFLAFHAKDSLLEAFKIHTDEEVQKLLEKRAIKKRKKLKKEAGDETLVQDAENESPPSGSEIIDIKFLKIPPTKLNAKVSSIVFMESPTGELPKIMANCGNSLRLFSIEKAGPSLTQLNEVRLPAHRTDIRTSAISSSGDMIYTACSENLRVWNREAAQCIHTLKCDYAVSSVLVPGDRFYVLGSKNGKLELFDVVEGSLHESIQAHSGAVYGLSVYSESGKSLVSGGDDKEVKFWDLEFSQQDGERKMTLLCRKAMKMEESILAVKSSPDQRLLAIALTDSTVKVLFTDSFKFFLSLYGHALPVTCLDISSDSQLIVTGSGDRNIKIWGLDFGDCHKSLFAHDDTVTAVIFIPKTHMFFSSGRDGKIKQWDADKFERITTFFGHQAEIWSLSLTSDGRTLVSTSHDRTIRIWEKTDEILVLEEERETERDAEFESQVNQGDEEPVIAGEINKEVGVTTRKSFHAVQAAEKIVEAIGMIHEERAKKEAGVKNEPNPLLVALGNISAERYVLHVIKRVKPSELQGTLFSLALNDAMDLVLILERLLTENSQTELIIKCLTCLLKVNALQVESNKLLLSELDELRSKGQKHVDNLRDLIGFNLATLQALQQQMDDKEEVKLFTDARQQFTERKKKQKRHAILSMAT